MWSETYSARDPSGELMTIKQRPQTPKQKSEPRLPQRKLCSWSRNEHSQTQTPIL